MGVSDRVGADLALIRSEDYAELCRLRPEHFTRRRKLPREMLVQSLLVRKGRTLRIELRELGKEWKMPEAISKTGYLKAREKLNPLALRELARHHAAGVYADGDFRTYKGMVVVAVDGSTANVPTTQRTLSRWGTFSAGESRPQATMGVSAAFDPLTRQILDATLGGRGKLDERAQVPAHLAALPGVIGDRPILLVLDRGYPSLHLMSWLGDRGVPYLMRCKAGFLKKEFAACGEAGGDGWQDVEVTRRRLQRCLSRDPEAAEELVRRGHVRARLALLDVGKAKPERIVTNVGADLLSAAELAEVYHLRWGVETCFEFMKDRLQLENFTATSPTLVEQDFWATVYLTNLAFDLANEAEAACADRASRYKHQMAVNRTYTIAILKDELLKLLLADDAGRDAMMAGIVAELGRSLEPCRPERDPYPRDGLKSHRACKFSNTHKRAF